MIEIILTQDGSHTLRNTQLNETYHSVHGAVQESEHVFIKHGLEFVLKKDQQEVSVLEIGFGTGLNAWLTAKRILAVTTSVRYVTLEPFPLEKVIWSELNYARSVSDVELFKTLHEAGWGKSVQVTPDFAFYKERITIHDAVLPPAAFDVIYFDAFAPDKQPEMWLPEVYAKIVSAMKPGGTFVTYCAKGQVKRDLKEAGFSVETLPGPPGKREMIRAHLP